MKKDERIVNTTPLPDPPRARQRAAHERPTWEEALWLLEAPRAMGERPRAGCAAAVAGVIRRHGLWLSSERAGLPGVRLIGPTRAASAHVLRAIVLLLYEARDSRGFFSSEGAGGGG